MRRRSSGRASSVKDHAEVTAVRMTTVCTDTLLKVKDAHRAKGEVIPRPRLNSFVSCAVAIGLFLLTDSNGSFAAEIVVRAGQHDRVRSMVQGHVPSGVDTTNIHLETADGRLLPAQVDIERKLRFILPGILPAGESQRFRVVKGAAEGAPDHRAGIMVSDGQDGVLHITANRSPVLDYHVEAAELPPDANVRYRRSGHIHPVYTPAGLIVSDEYPLDHMHQHALFAAWVHTRFEGRVVDFWNEAKGQGRVEHRELISTSAGPVWGGFRTKLAYVDLTNSPDGTDVLHEEWDVKTYAVPNQSLLEITSTQTNVADSPLTLLEYHYGGMAFRGSGQWTVENSNFLTSDGKTRTDGNHTRANWVVIHGNVNDLPCGIAVFSHPSNFRSPQPVRLHPTMPYFVFTPPALGEFEIQPREQYTSRYAYFVFDGAPDVGEIGRIWRDYATPATLEWVE